MAVLAAAAVLVAVAIGVILARPGGQEEAGPLTTSTTTESGASDPAPAPDRTAGVPTSTSMTSTSTRSITTTTLAKVPYDRWITVMVSRSKAEHTLADVEAEADDLRSQVGGDDRIHVIDSDDNFPLKGGYWVIASFDFGSREQALAVCATFHLPVGDCNPAQTHTGQR